MLQHNKIGERMRMTCVVCKRNYSATRRDSKTCSPSCRRRKANGAKAGAGAPESPVFNDGNSLMKATRAELDAAGKLDSMLGQQALTLVARMEDTDTPAGIASLSRELRAVMAAALGSSASGAKPQQDSVDQLKARRDAKRSG
ncbi:hypothetical protein [Mycolicibacterium sp.]|uniref:hypothetical protein n=1 Tax=Mycolicibacterium sp. TaxID=2320850 RepID=UPI0025EC4218|nr:hypothetical protein [Mycolicibacterium sp.]